MLFIIKSFIIYLIIYFFNIDLLKNLPIILPILLAVAFFTVFERKILAGCNVVEDLML